MKKLIKNRDSKLSEEKTSCESGSPARMGSRAFALRFFEEMAQSPLSMQILRHSAWRCYTHRSGGQP